MKSYNHNSTEYMQEKRMSFTAKKKWVNFLTLNLTFLSIILECKQQSMRCYQTFPTPRCIEKKSPWPKLQSVEILWFQVQSQHPAWVTVCSAVWAVCLHPVCLTCQRQQCLLQCRPALPSPLALLWDPLQSLSACSFIRKTDTPSFYDWRAAINTPPHPQSIYGCW